VRVPVTRGHHRLAWDLRYPPPAGTRRQFSIAAVFHNTPSGPVGPFVFPGRYTVRLTVDGVAQERPLDVRMDPRVTITDADLRLQTDLSLTCYRGANAAARVREALDADLARPVTVSGAMRHERVAALRGTGLPDDPDLLYGQITDVPESAETIVSVQEKFLYMLNLFQQADAAPTTQARASVRRLQERLEALERRWQALREGAPAR
jgi:hypothetical protein